MSLWLVPAACLLLAVASLPRWLPPAVVRAREWIFWRVNGGEGIPVPGPLVPAERFTAVYGHPAADGRSRGAGLSDLFWYWLAPGPQMHQEHLEPGARYTTVARTTRRVLAVPHRQSYRLAADAARSTLDRLPPGRTRLVRLRDLMMPVWADVYHEVIFGERCTPEARDIIVASADDVATALKCLRLRRMRRRDRLTRYLLGRVLAGTAPVTLPPPFTPAETAWYLQGAFFHTAVVQMSEAMAHLLLALARHPRVQHGLRAGAVDDETLDRVIDETLRLYPLFGIAHRITSAPIPAGTGGDGGNGAVLPTGSVLLFNYPAYHRSGPAGDDRFDPDRWVTLRRADAHFVPFGVAANRACPAKGAAPVMMRAVAREVLRRYELRSSVGHTRSLPSRGPCYLVPRAPAPAQVGTSRPRWAARLWTARLWAVRLWTARLWTANLWTVRLWALRQRDRWADVGRGLVQLCFGTWMVLDARRQRLCTTYFEQEQPP